MKAHGIGHDEASKTIEKTEKKEVIIEKLSQWLKEKINIGEGLTFFEECLSV